MACKACSSLKCFESCYSQFDSMKQSSLILQEADHILTKFNNQEVSISSLYKYITEQNLGDGQNLNFKNGNNNFYRILINYVFKSKNEENQDSTNNNKDKIVEILSILKFESIDQDFFYHYIFKKESQNNLIREDKIIYLLKIFDLNIIENILSIPSFSFIHSNYLSNCEFVNFFKAILSSSITNDFTSLYQSVFQYLEDQNEQGELTCDQFVEFMSKTFSINENFVNKNTNIERFTEVIRRIVRFTLLPSCQNGLGDQNRICLSDFLEIFRVSCRFVNMTLKYDVFDVAYKRKDFYFSGKVTNQNALGILDELSIIYTKLNKEKITNAINKIEITYFELLSLVSSEIDLSDIL